jgi:lipopolysaccharide transport system permease protein
LWQFTLRNVELRHKGSHLGLIWFILNPLLMLGLFVFIFGYIFNARFGVVANETRTDYALGIFIGLTLFHFAAEVLAASPSIIIGNANFVKKVVFPLEVLPAASVSSALIHFLITMVLALAGVAIFGTGLSLEALWLPVIVLPLVFLLLGVAWLLSALGVFFRDISQLIQFMSMTLLYASAVFYSTEKVPPAVWSFLRFNPLLLAVELVRNTTLWHKAMNLHHLAYLYAVSIVVCYLGHSAFRRMKPAFADVL